MEQKQRAPDGGLIPEHTGRLTVGCKITLTSDFWKRIKSYIFSGVDAGWYTFTVIPASRRRQPKGNPVPGEYNWATLFLGLIVGNCPPDWGSLRWVIIVRLWVLRHSDQWASPLQITDPCSCERGRPRKEATAWQMKGKGKFWPWAQRGADVKTNWSMTGGRKIDLNWVRNFKGLF
jgi:hypothetical protein